MEKITFTTRGGQPIRLNDFDRLNQIIENKTDLITDLLTQNYNIILTGCTLTTETTPAGPGEPIIETNTLTSGYIITKEYGIIEVPAQTYIDEAETYTLKVYLSTSYDSGGTVTFDDDTVNDVWPRELAKISGSTSGGYIYICNWTDLKTIGQGIYSIVSSSVATVVSTESSTRTSVDSSLATSISIANSIRSSADSSLSTLLSTETSTRSSADTSLATAIASIPTSLSNLNFTVFSIGDWDMDADQTVELTFANCGFVTTDIRYVEVLIKADSSSVFMLNTSNSGSTAHGSVGYIAVVNGSLIVTLWRTTGGLFDSTSFNQTSYNRGYITVCHI